MMDFTKIFSFIISTLLSLSFNTNCDAKSHKLTKDQAEIAKGLENKNPTQNSIESPPKDTISKNQSLNNKESQTSDLNPTEKMNSNSSENSAIPLQSTPRGRLIVVPQK